MEGLNVPKVTAPVFTASEVMKQDASSAATLGDGSKKGGPPPSRRLAEKKLEQMITCTGPELFVHGAFADVIIPSAGGGPVVEGLDEDNIPGVPSNLDTSCKEAAPFDMILAFMTAVMTREYDDALRVGREIIKIEPNNKIVADFIPVLDEIISFSDTDDETSESESSEDSGTSSQVSTSSSSEGDSESERSPSSSAESDDDEDDGSEGAGGGGGRERKKNGGDGSTSSSSSDYSHATCSSSEEEEGSDGSAASDDGYNSEELKTMNQLVNNVLKF